MNQQNRIKTLPSVCPLDRPDTCSLSAKVQGRTLIDVKGSHASPYTDGVVCNKIARYYPDLVHGDTRLTHPLKRVGSRGSVEFERITWDNALMLPIVKPPLGAVLCVATSSRKADIAIHHRVPRLTSFSHR